MSELWFAYCCQSDSIVPNGVIETDWAGMGTVRLRKCNHGRHAILKRCWGGKHSGRRFLGCPLKVLVLKFIGFQFVHMLFIQVSVSSVTDTTFG
jgi:hypothetical protein